VGVTIGLLSAMSSRQASDSVLSGTGTRFVAFMPADAAPGVTPPLNYVDPQNEGLVAVGNNRDRSDETPTGDLTPSRNDNRQRPSASAGERGAARIRTGDGGFAIRCLSRLATAPR
jgi:hypothetical protein